MKTARYIPSNYSLITSDDRFGLKVYGSSENDRIVAMCFAGKRSKPDWHHRFASQERLLAKINETIYGLEQWEARKQSTRAKRAAPHDVKVGDIFRCSWGYDQTNIEYFQCTRLVGDHSIEVRAIAQDREETHYMQGECVPMRNAFTGDPMVKRVSMLGGEPSFKVYSFASAYRIKPVATVAGVPVFGSSHWTAYA